MRGNSNQFILLSLLGSELATHRQASAADRTEVLLLEQVREVVRTVRVEEGNAKARTARASLLEAVAVAGKLLDEGHLNLGMDTARVALSYFLLKRNVFS